MGSVKRTQIYLDEDLAAEIRQMAAAEGCSDSALIREAVRTYLSKRRSGGSGDPILALAGAFAGGPVDASTEHDRYLYGSA
jgi:Ribbon-helix-helix protein, copG family